jgi:hypothetical protein
LNKPIILIEKVFVSIYVHKNNSSYLMLLWAIPLDSCATLDVYEIAYEDQNESLDKMTEKQMKDMPIPM